MPEGGPTDGGQGGGNTQAPPASTGGQGGGTAGGAGDGAGDGDGDGDGGGGEVKPRTYDEAYVKKLRAEAAGNRTQLSNLQKELDALKNEKLTDAEKKDAELAKLREETQKNAARVKTSVLVTEAAKQGSSRPEAVAKLLSDSDVDIDNAKAVTQLVADAKADYPELFQKKGQTNNGSNGSADGGAKGNVAAGGMNDFIRGGRGARQTTSS